MQHQEAVDDHSWEHLGVENRANHVNQAVGIDHATLNNNDNDRGFSAIVEVAQPFRRSSTSSSNFSAYSSSKNNIRTPHSRRFLALESQKGWTDWRTHSNKTRLFPLFQDRTQMYNKNRNNNMFILITTIIKLHCIMSFRPITKFLRSRIAPSIPRPLSSFPQLPMQTIMSSPWISSPSPSLHYCYSHHYSSCRSYFSSLSPSYSRYICSVHKYTTATIPTL